MDPAEALLKEAYEQIKELRNKNSTLETQINLAKEEALAKDRKILHLAQRVSELVASNQTLTQQAKQREVVLRGQTAALHRKNVQIEKREEQCRLREQEAIKTLKREIEDLRRIVKEQEQELAGTMQEGEQFVSALEDFCRRNEHSLEERQLLAEFNGELQGQIEEVEGQNQKLLLESMEMGKQIVLQNEQGHDLLAQVEHMMAFLEVA